MDKYLLDVSVLVAWGWREHDHYQTIDHWIAREYNKQHVLFLTCSITELGFVRVSEQISKGATPIRETTSILHKMLRELAPCHHYIADDFPVKEWPAWCQCASQTTDAHLLLLAKKHGAHLATLDRKIPGAFLIE